MTRGLSKLLTATFTLILLGGVATPAVAYADSSTDTVAATTKADEQTYEISSAEIPYTSIIQNSQELKNYWFHKTADDANILEPHSLTMAQLKDNTYLSNLSAANNNDPYALQMGAAVTQIFGESMTLSKGESVGEYLFSRSTDDHFTFDEYREVLSIQMYISTWMTKYLTLAKNNQISDEAISTDYNENLRPIIVTLADHDEQLRSFDTLFGTAENFSGWKNYLIDNLLPSTITSAHLDGLTDEQLAKSSPSVSADIAKSVWDAPMTDYLTKQSDGTYQLNGLILFGVFNVISDGTTVTKPTIPVIPDPTPTPTPAKSQPVTVTYVDDQGKTLAPSKT